MKASVQQYEPPAAPLRIAPNPASAEINVQWPESLTAKATLSLTNIEGKLLKTMELRAGTNNTRLNITDFSPGMYFIEIQMLGGRILTGKVLKN